MKKGVKTALVVVVVALGAFFFIRARSGGDEGKIQYRVATVHTGIVRKTVSATGTVQPWTTVDIKSKAGGRIDLLAVNVGDHVKPGQIIAKIDPTDTLLSYNQSKADTDSAKAKEGQSAVTYQMQIKQSTEAVDQAQANLKASQANEAAAAARLQTARDQYTVQPGQTSANISAAQASYDSSIQDREQLKATQAQDRADAQGAYDEAVANNNNAQTDLKRQQALLDAGYVAKQIVDVAVATAAVAASKVTAAKAHLDTIAAQQKAAMVAADAKVKQALGQLNVAKSQADIQTKRNAVSEAEAAYKQAHAQTGQSEAALRNAIAEISNNEIRKYDIASAKASREHADAALTNAKTTLDQTTVRALSEGVVLQKYVEQGTIITSGLSLNSTGTSIVQLGDVTKLYVNVLVDETDIASVSVGQKVNVTLDAYPGVPFKGTVALIDPLAQVVQNVTSIAVRVELDNTQDGFSDLKPNMNATCEFIVQEKRRVLTIPSDAVQTDDKGSYVQVMVKPAAPPAPAQTATGQGRPATGNGGQASGGSRQGSGSGAAGTGQRKRGNRNQQVTITDNGDVVLERRPVEVGFQGDDSVEILSGLKEGERVVTQTIKPQPKTPAAGAQASPFGGGGARGLGGGGGGGRGR